MIVRLIFEGFLKLDGLDGFGLKLAVIIQAIIVNLETQYPLVRLEGAILLQILK